MKDLLRCIVVIGGFLGIMVCMYCDSRESMRRYEIEHNCRYDYNDLCYTRDERPYLFE